MNRNTFHILIPASVFILLLAALLYPVFAAHNAIIKSAHDYNTVTISNDPYILETLREDADDGVYATFIVKSVKDDRVVYRCEDRYRTMDLKSIDWAEKGCDIIVDSGDVGIIAYRFTNGTWVKQ